jgi:hypothetical protein
MIFKSSGSMTINSKSLLVIITVGALLGCEQQPADTGEQITSNVSKLLKLYTVNYPLQYLVTIAEFEQEAGTVLGYALIRHTRAAGNYTYLILSSASVPG